MTRLIKIDEGQYVKSVDYLNVYRDVHYPDSKFEGGFWASLWNKGESKCCYACEINKCWKYFKSKKKFLAHVKMILDQIELDDKRYNEIVEDLK